MDSKSKLKFVLFASLIIAIIVLSRYFAIAEAGMSVLPAAAQPAGSLQ